jgi:ABC-type nitrate/sulfonate/bicarbonate transport system ATPase subunit
VTRQAQANRASPLDGASKLRIIGATKVFSSPEGAEDIVALSAVDLEIGKHEFVCLLGPSGCGKTTLLNLIAGFLEPTSGQLLVDGEPILGASWDRGVVFQDYALFPWLTVRQNVQFGPRVRRLSPSQREKLADTYLNMVGLSEFGGRFPHELSGGMKQRVAIARALANRPSILLMDEPFGALDAMTRETMQDELRVVAAHEPKLIIFVTHSVAEAVFLADRVIVMSARPGRCVGEIRISMPHPRDRTAAEFNDYTRDIRRLLEPHVPASASIERVGA